VVDLVSLQPTASESEIVCVSAQASV